MFWPIIGGFRDQPVFVQAPGYSDDPHPALRKDIQEEEKKLEQLNKWTDDGNAERLRRFISLVRSWESSSACTPRYLPPNHGGH